MPYGELFKDTLNYLSCRLSMEALRSHFTGEANATSNISEADGLNERLHYKS